MKGLIKRRKSIETDSSSSSSLNGIKYATAPIDEYGSAGRWFRHKLLDGILVGTPVLLTIQRHRSPARTKVMKFFSFLGTEDFYTILFLFLYWVVDARLGRLFGVLMAVGFYTTGTLKTLFCLPRPPSPPIQPLEKAHDWALPSHHSLLGVVCPWYVWLYANVHYELSHLQMGVICCVIVIWSFGIMLSRLYLGVHSPADIVCGGVVGVFVLSMWMQVDDFVDFYISQRIELQMKMIVGIFFLLLLHPQAPGRGCPSFPDTCTVMGVFFGIVLGRSRQRGTRGWPTLTETYTNMPFHYLLLYTIARLLVGGLAIILTKFVLKAIVKFILLQICSSIGKETYSGKEYCKLYPINKHYNSQYFLPPIYNKATTSGSKSDADPNMEQQNGASEDLDTSKDSTESKDSASQQQGKNPRDSVEDDEEGRGGVLGCVTSYLMTWLPVNEIMKGDWNIDVPVNTVVYTAMSYVAIEISPQIFAYLTI